MNLKNQNAAGLAGSVLKAVERLGGEASTSQLAEALPGFDRNRIVQGACYLEKRGQLRRVRFGVYGTGKGKSVKRAKRASAAPRATARPAPAVNNVTIIQAPAAAVDDSQRINKLVDALFPNGITVTSKNLSALDDFRVAARRFVSSVG